MPPSSDRPTRPRSEAARLQLGSARSTLLSVFAEFALEREARVPARVLLAALGELGISTASARQALARCSRAGWLGADRTGRLSRWGLTAAGVILLEEGLRRVAGLGEEPAAWDGRWYVLVFSVPQEQRRIREHLYRSLRWIGLGNPLPGLWVMPRVERADRVERVLSRLGVRSTAVTFAGPSLPGGLDEQELVRRAWDLDGIAAHYQRVVERFNPGDLPPQGGHMTWLLQLDEELQRFPSLDPQLPAVLAPGWPGRASARRLLELRSSWLPAARRQWAHLLSSADG